MKYPATLLMLVLSISSQAQDLIINGSFEDANICTEIQQPCSPAAWFYPKSHPHGYSVRTAIKPSDGNRILALLAADMTTERRTYWQTMLLCPLIKGEEYMISVDMAAMSVGPNLNDLGFYFTDRLLHAIGDTLMQPPLYQPMLDAKVKRLSNGWFRLQKKFIANNDNQVMVVGNFAPASNKQIMADRNTATSISFFIDKLSLTPSGKRPCQPNLLLKDSLYALTDRHTDKNASMISTKEEAIVVKPVKVDTLILNNILFDYDKYDIKNPELFDNYASLLLDPSIYRIEIMGYTDDRGSEAYNLHLSKQRARSVADLISVKFSIAASLIESSGMGISNKFEDKQLNRRVEIYIYKN